ncbi:uncharacterized protein LOC124155484 [Ischnura elegans]|uniref:uncharacterized protein LOC124155484 n=1 Tax=Ischnura elegans TaxID=197161 RepID=UPI001ED86FD1|nr:uncharacterized protein LOC124155484 [Ischnura elegans]
MMSRVTAWWLVALVALLSFTNTTAAPRHEEKRGGASISEDPGARAKRQLLGLPSLPLMTDPRRKRPFCNAFTGCGRKRSEGELMQSGPDETLSTLLELNSEPAVAELSRQILSEAKLWEAIQEARDEMSRQRQRVMVTKRRRRREASSSSSSGEAVQEEGRQEWGPPPIPKGTLPSAGNGALPIV